ncbi:unnamed protein product [Paramecium sonneborni]|uniref:ADP/ATP translocase n=1 Tax=Paramecium sonneborni TaxID=65129 RepID=A0A8S1R299_9CILI|nr:unnamed protein product [Paramecium sonneborni]
MDFINDFMIGGIAAALSSIDYNPSVIKRPKFNNNENVKWYVESFRKAIQRCFSFIYGFNLANIPRYSLTQALNFSLNDTYKQIFCPYDPQNEKVLFFLGNIISGSVAGATSMFFIYPLDIARKAMISDMYNTEKKYKGLIDCTKKLFMKRGIKGIYRGFGISVSSVSLYRGIYFGIYDTAKGTIFNNSAMKKNPMAKFLFAILITELAGIISSPLDIIRRELEMKTGTTGFKYNNALHCAINIYEKQGINIIYKEAISNFYKRTSGALVLVVYDLIKTLNEDLAQIQEEQ